MGPWRQLYVTSLRGDGKPRALHGDPEFARYPVWAPGSERLLFLGGWIRGGIIIGGDIGVTSLETGVELRTGVTVGRVGGVGPFPVPGAWTHDHRMFFFAGSQLGSSHVWTAPLVPESGRLAADHEKLITMTGRGVREWAVGGGRFAYVAGESNTHIFSLPIDPDKGTVPENVAPEQLTDYSVHEINPSISSDGTKLVFASKQTGGGRSRVRPCGGEPLVEGSLERYPAAIGRRCIRETPLAADQPRRLEGGVPRCERHQGRAHRRRPGESDL